MVTWDVWFGDEQSGCSLGQWLESEAGAIKKVKLGSEVFFESLPSWFSAKRIGLLANQASVDTSFRHIGDLIRSAGGDLRCLFSPQHGFGLDKQANMHESSDSWSVGLRVPIFSLYGAVRQPTLEMLQGIDVLIVDLQDVGTRVYTYGITMGLCLEMASQAGVQVVVMDRPNPIGGIGIEGNLLDQDCQSFVGRYRIPMRHGLTMGELARLIVEEANLDCDLQVIGMQGWRRRDHFLDTGLPWIYPSPNVPTWETCLVYPGMVLFEGTNISEGRGTTLPFHLFGAPFLRQLDLQEKLASSGLEGLILRPVTFEPVFDKWRATTCHGFQVHIIEPRRFRPFRFGLLLLQALYQVHPEQFSWLPPPYEYETEKLPIEIIIGKRGMAQVLESGVDVRDLEATWSKELEVYRERCQRFFLYEE